MLVTRMILRHMGMSEVLGVGQSAFHVNAQYTHTIHVGYVSLHLP